MKRLGILLSFLFAFVMFSQAKVTVLKGVYQEKDIYIKNSFSSEGVGFCIFEVLVNGDVTSDEINSSAFVIDLHLYGFKVGDPIEIVIRSKEDCQPVVINEEAILPASTFNVVSYELNGNNLSWTSIREIGSIPFVVEQFKWNKWVEVAAIDGKGVSKESFYEVSVPAHKGLNIFRIKQKDSKHINYSEKMEFDVQDVVAINLLEDKVFEEIRFSQNTPFELYDEYGVLQAIGEGDRIFMTEMQPGRYFLNYGSQFGQVVIKK